MRSAHVLSLAIVLLGYQLAIAQENKPVKLPPSPPTIPSDVMFALGQQSGQLTGISGRLEKIESKIEDVQRDVTRINTVGGLAALLLTVVLGPLIVYQVRKKLDATSTPKPA
jgi:hypothetical protein